MSPQSVALVALLTLCLSACAESVDSATTPLPAATSEPASSAERVDQASAAVATPALRLAQPLDSSGVARLVDGDRSIEVRIPECTEASPDECIGPASVTWSASASAPAGSVQLTSMRWSEGDSLFSGALAEGHGATGYSVISSDIDGDGVVEFLFLTGRDGGYGGPSYTIYRWTQEQHAWAESAALSELTVGSTGVFSTNGKGDAAVWFADGCCRRIGERYTIHDGAPQLFERRTETLAEGQDTEVEVTTETFKDGKVISSKVEMESREGAK